MNKQTYLALRKSISPPSIRHPYLRHFLIDLVLVSATLAWCLIFAGSPFTFFASLGIAILMFRSFALMHEAVHGVASKSWVNDWIGIFYGGISLLAFEPWKRTHLEHHFWSGNAEKDPVMALLIVYPQFPKWLQNSLNFGWKKWLPIMAILQHAVFWQLSVKKILNSEFSLKMALSAVWPLFFWVMMFWKVPLYPLFAVVLPGLFIYLISVEIVNLPHHLRLPQLRGDERLSIWNQYQSSRSCIYPRWMEELITLNFNYHSEHHMFPDLEWFRLAEVHRKNIDILGQHLNTDAKFSWTFKHRSESLGFVLANNTPTQEPTEKPADWCPQSLPLS